MGGKLFNEVLSAISQRSTEQLKDDYYDIISDFKSWYRGNVEDFHHYEVRLIDGSQQDCEMLSLQMAKKVCEDMTDLIWSEKVKINIEDETANKVVTDALFNNNFQVEYCGLIEKAMALGTGVTVEFIRDGKVRIDYLEADLIVPFAWINQQITGLATMSQYKKGEYWYNQLAYHWFEKDTYFVEYEVYISNDEYSLGNKLDAPDISLEVFGDNTAFVTEDDKVLIVYKDTPRPFFQVIKPNIVNNLELRYPMGISLFGNSIDTLKALDEKYDSFTNEFKYGRKRIIVSSDAIKKRVDIDPNTQERTYVSGFDAKEPVFQAINVDSEYMKSPVQEVDFTLRTQEHVDAINEELNVLSTKTGLGNSYYQFDNKGLKTATEVVSENSDLYRTKTKHQQIIEKALMDLVYSILWLEKNALGTNVDTEVEVKINFDDSIVQDKDKIKEVAMNEVNSGVRSKLSYLMEIRGLTEEEAKRELKLLSTINQDTQMAYDLETGE